MGKKDPNAPKRPLSAYFAWLGENREKVKAENAGISHKEVTAKLGEMWNSLDEEVKKTYKEKATAEMQVWKAKFEQYKKTPEYADWQDKKAASAGPKGKKGKKKKPPKDPNAPKRPSTGFFLFVSEKRAEVKASLPESDQKKVTVITKKCGELWKAAGPEEQAKYKEKSKKLKEKYDEELAAYKTTQNYRDYQEILKDFKNKQNSQQRRQESAGRARAAYNHRQLQSDDTEESSDES